MNETSLIGPLAAGLALLVLGVAWTLQQRSEGPTVPALDPRLPHASRTTYVERRLFEGGAILELTNEALALDGALVLDLARRERWVGPQYGWFNVELRRALWRKRAQVEARFEAGEGPAFSGDLLLASEASVPADVAGEMVHTAIKAGFTRVYALAIGPDDAAAAPLREPGCFEERHLRIELLQGSAANVALPHHPFDQRGSLDGLAEGIRAAERAAPAPLEYAVLTNDGPVTWADAVAAMDALRERGYTATLRLNDRHNAPAAPPGPTAAPPQAALPALAPTIDGPLPVLPLTPPAVCRPDGED